MEGIMGHAGPPGGKYPLSNNKGAGGNDPEDKQGAGGGKGPGDGQSPEGTEDDQDLEAGEDDQDPGISETDQGSKDPRWEVWNVTLGGNGTGRSPEWELFRRIGLDTNC
ncbi:hypothetical protein CENSYa_1243 [Cenarchaeum symbiosum A]|uniref:Uncharacterized protein n=1 Tax=Cenarchaeum symbiosum (strain A) TaxID=414004 RepID=A0RWZ9_CENSY|nr:hypothetical protein CENSYa_1243 [Cenarchaeum symbiosum A]